MLIIICPISSSYIFKKYFRWFWIFSDFYISIFLTVLIFLVFFIFLDVCHPRFYFSVNHLRIPFPLPPSSLHSMFLFSYRSIHSFINSSFLLLIHSLFILTFIYLFFNLFIHSLIYSFILGPWASFCYLLSYLVGRRLVRTYIFIHSFNHPFQ